MKEELDAFDYRDISTRPRRKTTDLAWNVLTILTLLSVVCVGGLFLMIFLNPYSGFNPFPPPTLPATIALPTATPTPHIILPPTWTPTITPLPSETPLPSATPVPTDTPTPMPTLTRQSSITTTPMGDMPYILLQGDPKAIPNISHPEAGCSWMGVAGQAYHMNNQPVVGLFVQLGGELNGESLSLLHMTGTATQYGTGGYEIYLGDHPIASDGTLWVQLFDQAMLPLSDKIYFSTFSDCDKNLIVLNFKQVK